MEGGGSVGSRPFDLPLWGSTVTANITGHQKIFSPFQPEDRRRTVVLSGDLLRRWSRIVI
jgi:hypothetical protein